MKGNTNSLRREMGDVKKSKLNYTQVELLNIKMSKTILIKRENYKYAS